MQFVEWPGSQDPVLCAFDPHTTVGRIRYWKPRCRGVCWKLPWAKNRAEAWQELAWQLPVQTSSGTSEQKSAEMLQSRQPAGSDRAAHNIKPSLKPSTVPDIQPATPWESLLCRHCLGGRIRRKGTVTSTEAAALWARHWDRITSAKNRTSWFFSFPLRWTAVYI